jgi:arylsulfatase
MGGLTPSRDIEGLTQVQDILPTLIDLCGLDAPASAGFDGISLASVLRGESDVPENRMLVISYSRMPVGFNSPSPYSQSILTRDDAGVLWKRWRLLEDRGLYDLASDPLQQTNVIDRYPEIAGKMRKHLYDWWEEVKNIANVPQRIVIGHEKENPSMLTACEWLDVFVDQQEQVRRGTSKTGHWCLEVAEAGEYEFELRRWPKEIDVPLMESGTTNGNTLPIAKARIFINNANHLALDEKRPYCFEGLVKTVEPGKTSAIFTVKLEAGPMALHTWFDDKKGETICSAYYVYVRRL